MPLFATNIFIIQIMWSRVAPGMTSMFCMPITYERRYRLFRGRFIQVMIEDIPFLTIQIYLLLHFVNETDTLTMVLLGLGTYSKNNFLIFNLTTWVFTVISILTSLIAITFAVSGEKEKLQKIYVMLTNPRYLLKKKYDSIHYKLKKRLGYSMMGLTLER